MWRSRVVGVHLVGASIRRGPVWPAVQHLTLALGGYPWSNAIDARVEKTGQREAHAASFLT
jgi:hypothetical protein